MKNLLLLSLIVFGHAPPVEPKLSIVGDVSHCRDYTNAQLRQAFAGEIRDVPFTIKGEKGHAHAIPLLVLLNAAAPKVDPKRKHGPLVEAVVVSAADGYATLFSMGELTPEIGKRAAWVALDWNDQPLAGDDAPVRLIVPEDEKPSRWIHGVRSLRVVDLAPKGKHGPPPPPSRP